MKSFSSCTAVLCQVLIDPHVLPRMGCFFVFCFWLLADQEVRDLVSKSQFTTWLFSSFLVPLCHFGSSEKWALRWRRRIKSLLGDNTCERKGQEKDWAGGVNRLWCRCDKVSENPTQRSRMRFNSEKSLALSESLGPCSTSCHLAWSLAEGIPRTWPEAKPGSHKFFLEEGSEHLKGAFLYLPL